MEILQIVIVLVNLIVTVSGILCNVFIASVTLLKGQKRNLFRSPQDAFLLVLGISDAIILGFQFLCDMLGYIWKDEFTSFNLCGVVVNGVYSTIIFFSSCLTSWLCCIYCMKIVSFQNKFLRLLKAKQIALLPWMVVGTVMASGLLMVTTLGVIFISVPFNNTNKSSSYCAEISNIHMGKTNFIIRIFGSVTVLPFLLIVVSLSSILQSIILHVKTSTSLNHSHFKGHIEASKTILLLLVLNISFHLSQLFLGWNIFSTLSPWYWVCYLIYYLFWPLQALILIFRNKRFKVICIRFFHRAHTNGNVAEESLHSAKDQE